MKKTFLTQKTAAHALSLLAASGVRRVAHFTRTDDEPAEDDEDDAKNIKSQLLKIENKLAKGLDAKAAKIVQDEIKSLQDLIDKDKTASALEVKQVKDLADGIKQTLDLLDVKVQKMGTENKVESTKSFNEVLAETLKENAEKIKGHKKGEMLVIDMKEVGDMSLAANFSSAGELYQVQKPLYIPPFEQTFLGDILPGATSGGTGIVYPEKTGGEGGIDEWDGTEDEDKAQVDYDFTKREISFAWLAGIVIIEREMLDDIPWLTSYLQNQLLLDLKTRENAFILNRAVTGLLNKATPYNGAYSVPVERLIDAAYGQLPEDTFGQHRTTHFVMRPRETVKVGLNKAAGSQEFDLPQGTVGFSNGVLNLGGIQTVATTSIGANKFLALDARATQFVKRMQPEIRFFEDAALAKRNKIMIRIEERVALAVYNAKALVAGDLDGVI